MREGVRVIIRLSALDEAFVCLGQGRRECRPSTNKSHIFMSNASERLRPVMKKTLDRGLSKLSNAKPWLVFVVRCCDPSHSVLQIGPHTFHLHEIYGPTAQPSASAHTHAHAPSPTAPDAYTYPSSASSAPAATPEGEPSPECLVCLSAPREVIILPCRHLVACKECTLNTIELGAGGNITDNEAPGTTANTGAGAGAGRGVQQRSKHERYGQGDHSADCHSCKHTQKTQG